MPDTRIGTTEREQYVGYLQRAFEYGYLDKDELDDRIHQAFEARYQNHLSELIRDLPGRVAETPEKKSHVRLASPSKWWAQSHEGQRAFILADGFIVVLLGFVTMIVTDVHAHQVGDHVRLGVSGGLELAFILILGIPLLFGLGIGAIWNAVS